MKVAEEAYRIERAALALLQDEANDKSLTEVSRLQALADTRALVGRVLRVQDRIKDFTQHRLDEALPGEPPRKMWSRAGADLYHPLYRSGTPDPTKAQPSDPERYAEMLADFRRTVARRATFAICRVAI